MTAMTGWLGLPFWMPLIVAAAMVPESSESSPRYSGVRPDSGVRPEATPGPRMTFLPERNASSAWATPLSYASCWSNVAASPIWSGKIVTPVDPRT